MKKQQKKKTKKKNKKKQKKKIDYGYKVRETDKLHYIYFCIETLIDFNCNLEKCMWSIPSQ